MESPTLGDVMICLTGSETVPPLGYGENFVVDYSLAIIMKYDASPYSPTQISPRRQPIRQCIQLITSTHIIITHTHTHTHTHMHTQRDTMLNTHTHTMLNTHTQTMLNTYTDTQRHNAHTQTPC